MGLSVGGSVVGVFLNSALHSIHGITIKEIKRQDVLLGEILNIIWQPFLALPGRLSSSWIFLPHFQSTSSHLLQTTVQSVFNVRWHDVTLTEITHKHHHSLKKPGLHEMMNVIWIVGKQLHSWSWENSFHQTVLVQDGVSSCSSACWSLSEVFLKVYLKKVDLYTSCMAISGGSLFKSSFMVEIATPISLAKDRIPLPAFLVTFTCLHLLDGFLYWVYYVLSYKLRLRNLCCSSPFHLLLF